MAKRKRTPEIATCTLCRTHGPTNREHVIPSCMYRAGEDKEVIVRLCLECNNLKSKYDAMLRTVFASSPASTAHSSVVDAAMRSIKRGDLTKDLLHQVPILVPYYNHSGQFIGNHIALCLTKDAQDAVFYLVRELYSYFFPGEYLLGQNLRFLDTSFVFSTCLGFYSSKHNGRQVDSKKHADSVLKVNYDYFSGNHKAGVWSLQFYDDRRIFVISISDSEGGQDATFASLFTSLSVSVELPHGELISD